MHTGSGFDEIDPNRALYEIVFLEVLGKGLDEVSGRDVLHCEESLLYLSEHWW